MSYISDPLQADETRKLLKHNDEFREYLKSRPTSANTTAITFNSQKRIINQNEKIQEIKQEVKKINKQ